MESNISQLLDEASKHYTKAMVCFFISGLTIGAGIGYLVAGK